VEAAVPFIKETKPPQNREEKEALFLKPCMYLSIYLFICYAVILIGLAAKKQIR